MVQVQKLVLDWSIVRIYWLHYHFHMQVYSNDRNEEIPKLFSHDYILRKKTIYIKNIFQREFTSMEWVRVTNQLMHG